jgi:hypothetical protein
LIINKSHFSRHFLLPSNTLKPKSINECMPMIGARFYAHIDNLHVRGDILENELSKVGFIKINYVYNYVIIFRNLIVVVYFD